MGSTGISPGPGAFAMPPPGALGGLLGNPALMNMATTMLADPNMQQMMGQLMSGGMPGGPMGPPGAAPGDGPGGPGNLEGLLQAGQRLAEQMQQSNPELVDQLRRQMGGPGGPPDEDQNPPPGTS